MNVHVVVTEKDIRKGQKLCPERCPISRAIIRATGYKDCRVGVSYARVYPEPDNVQWARIPRSVQNAIVRFDRTGCMELLEFDLEFE